MCSELLVSALSALTRSNVVTYQDYDKNKARNGEYSVLDLKDFHQQHLLRGSVLVVAAQPSSKEESKISITIITLTGENVVFRVDGRKTIKELILKLAQRLHEPAKPLRLLFNDRQLEEDLTLRDHKIRNKSTLYLQRRSSDDDPPISSTYVIPKDELLSPEYDYDFTNVDDEGATFMRGNFQYKRPCGWKRFALNVLDKYEDNMWLGVGDRSSQESAAKNEWPVSYHGTALHNCLSIAEDGYRLSKGCRFRFGKGIYTTPDIELAYLYATKFKHQGHVYRVAFQNRVNPYTLVRIPTEKTGASEYWISPDNNDVRPYGICIRKKKHSKAA